MKILEIISAGYEAGGAETLIVKIKPYLLAKGYSVKTLASDMEPAKKHFNEYVFKSLPTGPLKLLFLLFNPASFFALRRVLKEYKPDIVHFHTMNQVTPSALFLLKHYPAVMTLHGPESFLSNLLIWFLPPTYLKSDLYDKKHLNMKGKLAYFYFNYIQKMFYKLGLRNVDMFIAPSKFIQQEVKSDVSPVMYLPHFMELREFHEIKQNYNLLFVGRLEKFKGVEFLIKAIPEIIRTFPQTTLTIIGDGPYKSNLITLTKKLQFERHIQFTGWLDSKDLDTFYEKASVVVTPSLWPEAFGLVVLEAMSRGRPVIATKAGGLPEIIDDGVNGYLVATNHPEQIAEKVIKLFSDEKLLAELGRNARKKAEDFSIEEHLENLGKMYQEIIRKYKQPLTTRTNQRPSQRASNPIR